MAENTRKLADFVLNSKFSDLPGEVIQQSKRALLDAAGCAITGLTMQASKVAVELAKSSRGLEESSILGTSYRVPCANAAFANGQLINSQDFDPGSVSHDSPPVIAGSLAAAEAAGASGKELIMAVALGHEISTRLKAGEAAPSVGGAKGRGPVPGYAFVSLAVAALSARLLGASHDQMRHAMGVASFIHPPNNSTQRYFNVSPVWNVKYTVFGRIAEAGVTAALLAKRGFTADPDVLDSEICFWKVGDQGWQPDKISDGLGQWKHVVSHKRFPSNLPTAGGKECFIALVEENNIQPDEIEKVVLMVRPVWQFKSMWDNKLRTEEDFCFNIPYQLGCAAYRIKPTHWLDPEVRQDPRIRAFMQRVQFDIGHDPVEFERAKQKDPTAESMSAEIAARGKTFKKHSTHYKGQNSPPEFRFTDGELSEKFSENVSRVLSKEQTSKAIAAIFKLEEYPRAADVIRLLSPEQAR
jgi:2-methylcitrate dehydratase PrpD